MDVVKYLVPRDYCISIPQSSFHLTGQPTDMTCWAAVGAMMMNWHDGSYPRTISQALHKAGPRWAAMFRENKGLPPKDVAAFAHDCGMLVEPLQCYSLKGWIAMLRNHGPLAVMEGGSNWLHAWILLGIELAAVQPVSPTAGVAAVAGAIPGGIPATDAIAPALGVVHAASRIGARARALIIDPWGPQGANTPWGAARYYESLDQYIESFENLDAWVKPRLWIFGHKPVLDAKIWHY